MGLDCGCWVGREDDWLGDLRLCIGSHGAVYNKEEK